MKTFIKIYSALLIMALFTQCGAQKFDKKTPFTITKAYYQDWFGGRGASKGTKITLELKETLSNKIVLDSIFFKNKKSKLNFSNDEKKFAITGNFVSSITTDRDIIMHSDSRKEMANKVPDVLTSIPFKLSDKECVISYFMNNKKHYYKVTNLIKENPIYYP